MKSTNGRDGLAIEIIASMQEAALVNKAFVGMRRTVEAASMARDEAELRAQLDKFESELTGISELLLKLSRSMGNAPSAGTTTTEQQHVH